MTIKIGINGLGRIGRMVIRSLEENKNKDIKIVHVNNRTNSENSSLLLKYDSVHGKFNANIDFDKKNLIINNKKIHFSQETEFTITIEAGSTSCWQNYIVNKGLNFGIDNFGKSAPYKKIYNYFGLTAENITKKTMEMINK